MFVLRILLVMAATAMVVHVSECIELKRLSALSTSSSTTTTIAPSPTTLIAPSSAESSAATTTMKPPTSTTTMATTQMVDSATTTSAPMQQILVFNEKTQIFELVPNISLNAIVVDFDPVKDLNKSMGRVLGDGDDQDKDGIPMGFSLNCLNCENGMPVMNSSLCSCKSNNTAVTNTVEIEPKSTEAMSTISTSTPAPTAATRTEESQPPSTTTPTTTTITTMVPTVARAKPTRTWDAPKRLRNWNPLKSSPKSWDLGKRTRTWDTPRRIVTTTTAAPVQTTKKPEPQTRAKIIISSNSGFDSNRDHSRPRVKATRRKQPKNSNPSSPNQNGVPQCQYVACISPCYIFRTSLDECPECSCPEFNRFDKIKFFATSSFEPSFKQDRFRNQTFN